MEVEDHVNSQDPATLSLTMKKCLLARNKLAMIIKGPGGDSQFCCVQCPVKSYLKDELERHLLVHNKEYRHLCGICGTGLKRKEHLDRHTLEHQQVRPHVCEVCSKAFKRKEHLNIHRSIHSGDKNEVCMLCHKSFYRKDHLQKHLQTHSKMFLEQNLSVDPEFVNIKAEVMELDASERFDDSSQDAQGFEDIQITPDQGSYLDSSIEITPDQGHYIDSNMEITPDQGHYLDSNMEITPDTGSYLDSNIEITPDQGSYVEAIIEQPEKKELRPFACNLCEKTYKRKDHLKLHTQTHMKKDKICSECGKAFVTDEKLLQHMNMHLNAYSIMNGDEDKTHLQALLAEHNIDPSFLQADNNLLVPRMSVPHTSVPHTDEAGRRHECNICHRKFKRRQHLLVHQNVHNKTSPNIWCSKCNEGFFTNQAFESHECMCNEEFLNIKIEPSPPITQLDIKVIQPDAKKENEHPQIKILPLESREDSTIYSIHDESYLPTPRKVYVCKYCNKPFKRKDHYKIHLHIHTGVKSFFCTVCDKGFYRKDHLQKHMYVHSKTKEKPKKAIPDLFPIKQLQKRNDNATRKEILPEITIHAPSNTKLRVPLQIKVPYQVVMSMANGEERSVTVDPQANNQHEILS